MRREVAFDSVQIGMAKSAEVDLHANLARRGSRSRYMPHGEWRRFSRPRLVKYHGTHSDIVGDQSRGDGSHMFDEKPELSELSLKR